jgi:hypothetical protein
MFVKVRPRYKIKNWKYPNKDARWVDRETGLRKNYDGTLEKPKFMTKIKGNGSLTKKQKKVAVKIMYEAGWGTKRLSQWFKTSQMTISRWKDIPTPESLQLFEQSYKAAMMDYDMQSVFGIKSRIMQLIPHEENIDKLVKAGEFFSGERERRTQNNTQVNVYGSMLKKYGEQTTEMPVSIISKTIKK